MGSSPGSAGTAAPDPGYVVLHLYLLYAAHLVLPRSNYPAGNPSGQIGYYTYVIIMLLHTRKRSQCC